MLVGSAMIRLLILLTLPEKIRMQYYRGLREAFPEMSIDLVDHHSKVDPCIGSADILLTFGAHMADHVLEKGKKLKWIQALGTGVDGIVDRPPFREGVLVTNMHGLHGDSVPEAAVMLMFALARDLPRAMRNRDARKWERYPSQLLKGKTVGIFGVGAIARSLAPKCKSFGMRVVGITSSVRSMEGFDRMVHRDEIGTAVRELDFLVLLTPYTAETRGIVGEKVIGAMKPSAFLVNLARGGIVDEDALVSALREGRLAGAALDVFATEPLPEDHPLWSMDNVIVTPHLGGFHDQYAEEALPTVVENFRKFLAGELDNMKNVVKR
ncbi:MAG TPA: D-2-hydroxyacid dehydrogenase [Burkholderiales bacterium]|nr:D-2-hydroxyacid dehydrogenase [Burkholderiales bacterium]